jgi:hypothetical protein
MLIFVLACHPVKKGNRIGSGEDFDSFYVRFHTDSLFQIERVKFPLEGAIYDNDKEKKWSKKDWQQIKYTVYEVDTGQFKVEFNKTDSLVSERIYIPNSGFDFQCRYRLIKGKWFLVYCLDQNL